MKNELTKQIVELLIILNEECCELGQVCCKVQRFGLDQRNKDKLVQEIGDVVQMISMVADSLEISWDTVERAAKAKSEKLLKYTYYQRNENESNR